MQLPTRRSEKLRSTKTVYDFHVTAEAMRAMQREIERLKKNDRPKAIAETQRTAEMGDFSENVAYQLAKARLRRINDRILTLEDRLKYAILIEDGPSRDGLVRIGSTVVLEAHGKKQTLQILGVQESNPTQGKISHLSPIGAALLGRKAGEKAVVNVGGKKIVYGIVEVN